jgi:hypothetical protein
MARRRKKSRGLGYITIQRFVVDKCMPKHVYTNVVDALLAAKSESRPRIGKKGERLPGKTCRISYGLPGHEARIAECKEKRCKTPGGQAISMRKLYAAEQGARPEPLPDSKRGRKKGRSPAIKATKTKLTQYERRALRTKLKKER